MVPFGFVDDGLEEVERTDNIREPWAIEHDFRNNFY
jgi:hypothetical protein